MFRGHSIVIAIPQTISNSASAVPAAAPAAQALAAGQSGGFAQALTTAQDAQSPSPEEMSTPTSTFASLNRTAAISKLPSAASSQTPQTRKQLAINGVPQNAAPLSANPSLPITIPLNPAVVAVENLQTFMPSQALPAPPIEPAMNASQFTAGIAATADSIAQPSDLGQINLMPVSTTTVSPRNTTTASANPAGSASANALQSSFSPLSSLSSSSPSLSSSLSAGFSSQIATPEPSSGSAWIANQIPQNKVTEKAVATDDTGTQTQSIGLPTKSIDMAGAAAEGTLNDAAVNLLSSPQTLTYTAAAVSENLNSKTPSSIPQVISSITLPPSGVKTNAENDSTISSNAGGIAAKLSPEPISSLRAPLLNAQTSASADRLPELDAQAQFSNSLQTSAVADDSDPQLDSGLQATVQSPTALSAASAPAIAAAFNASFSVAAAKDASSIASASSTPAAVPSAHTAIPQTSPVPASAGVKSPPASNIASSTVASGSASAQPSSQTPFDVFFSEGSGASASAAGTLPKMILPPSAANSAIHLGSSSTQPNNIQSPGSSNSIKANAGAQTNKPQPGPEASNSSTANAQTAQPSHTNADMNSNAEIPPALAPIASTTPAAANLPASIPQSTNPNPPSSEQSSPESSAHVAQLPAPTPEPITIGPVQAAQIVNRAGQSEMRIGLNTTAFGSVEVRTVVRTSDVGLVIGSEKGDLHTLLANDMPAITNSLQQQNLRLNSINFMQGFTSGSGGSGSGSFSQQRSFVPATSLADSPARDNSAEDSSGNQSELYGGSNLSILA